MPNRKQRRRKSKDLRHDVRVYEVDEDGNEVLEANIAEPIERQANCRLDGLRRELASKLRRQVSDLLAHMLDGRGAQRQRHGENHIPTFQWAR